MECKEFIEFTVKDLDDEFFSALKERLLGEYLSFAFITEDKINKDIFSEKLCDYFETLKIKTKKDFEKILLNYMETWYKLLSPNIAPTPSTKKNEPSAPTPRARKYYEKIFEIMYSRNFTQRQLVDFTRIAMCLYSSVVEKKGARIEDFRYPNTCLELDKIISALKAEKPLFIKKPLFDISDLYCLDTSMFIISMILYYHIKNNAIEGEY